MKKIYLLIIAFPFFGFAQCSISELTLGLLGKEYYELNNYLYSNTKVSNIIENMQYGERKIPDYKANFNYLNGDHYQKFVDFNYQLHNCFTNLNKTDIVKYSIKLIDGKVYKITIKKKYNLDDDNLQSDLQRLTSTIKKSYTIPAGNYEITHRFNITKENQEGDKIVTGISNYFDKIKLKSTVNIWKINNSSIESGKDYSNSGYGYSLPATNSYIEIEFINLNNTVLDNRGY